MAKKVVCPRATNKTWLKYNKKKNECNTALLQTKISSFDPEVEGQLNMS